jgi:hypothetical protein
MLTPSKTVLIIGDEALYIFSSGFKGLELIESVPWGADRFEENVSKIISRDCGNKPVVVLNDMVEQHYRKERVPKVNIMDRKNVLNRKLHVAFQNYPVKAAFPLKEKIPKTDKMPAANVYIFAAAPSSDQYRKTMDAAKRSMVSISGYGLLPVEGAAMLKDLTSKLASRVKEKSKWAVFIGQHQNGGLRQIVIKDGELALTRMTPVVDTDADSDVWASEIYQEFQATLSYMARFGFNAEDGLDIIVTSNPAAGAILKNMIDVEANVYTLTASEIAQKLGLSISSYIDQRYADILYAAWICKKSVLKLPMQAKEINEISGPRRVATLASVLLIAASSYLGYQAFSQYSRLSSLNNEIAMSKSQTSTLKAAYDQEVAKKEALGFDVRLVQSSITIRDELESKNIKPVALFLGLGNGMGRDLRADIVTVTQFTPPPVDPYADTYLEEQKKTPVYEARLQLTFPRTTDIDKGNAEITALRDRLARALPNDDVSVDKYLKDTEYVDELVVGKNDIQQEDVEQDFIVSLTIRGGAKS